MRFCQGRKPAMVLGVNEPLLEGVKQREGDGSAEGPMVQLTRLHLQQEFFPTMKRSNERI